MKTHTLCALVIVVVAGVALAETEPQGLSLAKAQSMVPRHLTLTGRVQPLISSRIGARLSGHLHSWGTNEQGQMLDAGMQVKEGQFLFGINPVTFENARAVAQAAVVSAQAALANLTAPIRSERLEQLKAVVTELEARIEDRQRDEVRFVRLVEQDKTLPLRRLEEVRTELAALRAQRTAAAARLQEAQAGPTKTEIAMAEARVKEAQAALAVAETDLRDTKVVAPFAGLITRRFRSPGDYLANMPPTEVLELVSADQLEADVRLPESYFPSIQAGQSHLKIYSPLLKAPLSLPVTRVVADVDPVRGTFAVRLSIPPQQRQQLVPGAFISAELAVDGKGAGVLIPQRALTGSQDDPAVFVLEGDRLRRRSVQLGDRLTENVVVRRGLDADAHVVVGALEALKDNQPAPSYLRRTTQAATQPAGG